jgi:hypothetical protein
MKFTLLILLSNLINYNTISSSTTGSYIVCGNISDCKATSAVSSYSKIKITMPDLKSCLEARKQFDDNSNVIVAACSAE